MIPSPHPPDPGQFRTPAIRHLAWMLSAPQLLESERRFDPAQEAPGHVFATLAQWDRDPGEGPAVLTDPPQRRLGLHFEQLYHCLMEDLLGWQVLVRNLPIRRQGITLGELDFIVRNPATGDLEHHEIAVKFYLGYLGESQVWWYGPNARDRLDLKTRRLLDHQSHLTELPETREHLAGLGLNEPLIKRVYMPGYLFYPRAHHLAPPADVPAQHLRGEWVYRHNLDKVDTSHWVTLDKPHWLGPWQQREQPDEMLTCQNLEAIDHNHRPRLFAELVRNDLSGYWEESRRVFVMPPSWPG